MNNISNTANKYALERLLLMLSCFAFISSIKLQDCCRTLYTKVWEGIYEVVGEVKHLSSELRDIIDYVGAVGNEGVEWIAQYIAKRPVLKGTGLIATGAVATSLLLGANLPSVIVVPENAPFDRAMTIKTASGKVRFSEEEKDLMRMAYSIGQELAGDAETIQAILLVETYAGRYGDRVGDTHLAVGKRSYGVGQVKAATARMVLSHNPQMVKRYFKGRNLTQVLDEEIIAKLIADDEFCIRVATLNFVLEKKRTNSWSRAVVAYNAGQAGERKVINADQFGYTIKIRNHIKNTVRPVNKELGLGKI